MQRDFVIQLRPETDVRAGQFAGRVEHIDSGRSTHFRTIQDFLAFVAHAIQAEEAGSADPVDAAEDLTLL
jgi:hypothetical protein